MKTTLISLGFVLAIAGSAATAAQLAGLLTVNAGALVFGALVMCSTVGLLRSDYSRRPSFRVRRTAAPGATAIQPKPAQQEPALWTYTSSAA